MNEWLLANERGSFAMGTRARRPARKYHALLVARDLGHDQPHAMLLELSEQVEHPDGSRSTLQAFDGPPAPEAVAPATFSAEPVPCWRYALPGGLQLERELRLVPARDELIARYRIQGARPGTRLFVRPVLVARPVHHLAQENAYLNGRATIAPGRVLLRPYPALPELEIGSHPAGRYIEAGHWLRGIHYAEEAARGYPAHEDAFVPGQLLFELGPDGPTEIALRVALGRVTEAEPPELAPASDPLTRLARACCAYRIRRSDGSPSLVAGYPWFDEWSRDALIALPGVVLATGDLAWAHGLLDTLARTRADGLVVNILPRGPAPADPHSIDASLLFIRAVAWLERAAGPEQADRHAATVLELIARLERPTAIGSWTDEAGELYAAGGDRPLTWMDARVDGRPVTPRAPQAVEICALWIAAQRVAARLAWRSGESTRGRQLEDRAQRLGERFLARYWLEAEGYLADAYGPGGPDRSLRPNQVIAAALADGPLPVELARRALRAVDAELLCPMGLRTLSPRDPAYRGRCEGDQRQRDLAYHQGTVWPWLLGPYMSAQRRVDPGGAGRRMERVLAPLLAQLDEGCYGHVGEIYDGDAPHLARGAPAQAWSVAEAYRVARVAQGRQERVER